MKFAFRFLAVLACFTFAGCLPSAPKPAAEAHAEHDHPEFGPHKGDLIELGKEEFHAELVHDDATHTVTVYVLDDHAKEAVGTAATEVELKLVADGKPAVYKLAAKPQPGDKEGMTSAFASSDETLAEALDKGATGRLNITVGGKDLVGEIKKHDHAGHKH